MSSVLNRLPEWERVKIGVSFKIVYLRMNNEPIDERLLYFSRNVNANNYEELKKTLEGACFVR